MDQPPVIQAEPIPDRKAGLGRIGLCCSLVALGAMVVMWLCKPG